MLFFLLKSDVQFCASEKVVCFSSSHNRVERGKLVLKWSDPGFRNIAW